ncbi:MAG: TonB-dependent receptor, partial [Cyclobacteriaceae bacterium]|nr:TonB-dependent receptor [Cyclobacteriaceae bacterium]
TLLKTSLSVSGNGLTHKEQRLDDNLQLQPQSNAFKNDYRITLQSNMTHYFSEQHSNRTGFYISHLGYDLDIEQSMENGTLPINLIKEKGQSGLFQFYSQSKINLTQHLMVNAGFHIQYFMLNKNKSIEPRVALEYQLNKKQSVALAYGLHSKIESLPIYFVKEGQNQPNKELKLMNSNHFVLSFNSMLTENIKLSVEPYYQYLTNVPVAPNGYISTLNIQNSLFFDNVLVSNGKGRNRGVDLSLESYLNKGLYYMFSASIFDSKYTANDGIERSARFNKNYVLNALVGKEWQIGKDKNNLFSANIRLNYLGGNRVEPIDEQSSLIQQDIIYGETNGNLSFTEKYPDTPILSCTFSYIKNKPKYSSVWSLQILNATQTQEFETDYYNIQTHSIESKFSRIMIPNLSYKIEF